MPTAIMVDGGFFLKRFPHVYPRLNANDPQTVAKTLHGMALDHLSQKEGKRKIDHGLYRIFFYDCAPLLKRVHLPVSNVSIVFKSSDTAIFRLALHEELKKMRKVALRLGHLKDGKSWVLNPRRVKELLAGDCEVKDLIDRDFLYNTQQKGVDMRLGIDIASLAIKGTVDQIILISGDSDFVPAAKLARREGIDFILDPMWNNIHSDLNEHVDGIRSICPQPVRKNKK